MTEQIHVDAEGSIVIPLQNGEEITIPGQLRYKEGDHWRLPDMELGCEEDGRRRLLDMDDVEKSFSSWACCRNRNYVYDISQEFHDEVLHLSVLQLYPVTFEGHGYSSISYAFSYGPCQDIFWSRSPANVPDSAWREWDEQMLKAISKEQSLNYAFDLVLQANLNNLGISKMKDAIAYDVLYKKLLHHPTVTKLDIPSAQYCKGALVEFCCNLIANSDTLEEVFFQDIGSLDENMVQKLFQALMTSPKVKVLDLRTSRLLETWDKASPAGHPRGFMASDPVIPVEPILEALECGEGSQCSLQTLDFGGNMMPSSSPICPLVTILLSPSLGLQRVSFRGCALTEAGLLSVAKELETNNCLEFLDLSHNVITKPAMQQLAKSLAKNTTLRKLKLEHCKIDLDIVKCLANSLPEMEGLQHLHMDGNEFTSEPSTETGESIGAVAIVEALETNKSLLSLEMGKFGRFENLDYGICYCQPPGYNTALCQDNLTEMDSYLERNEATWKALKESRALEAVVGIAEILLSKLANDAACNNKYSSL